MRFRDLLLAEFNRRRAANRRYSLRAFARALSLHHATLSRILRRQTAMAGRSIAAVGPRIGLTAEEIREFAERENELAVLDALGLGTFRPDSRWLASVLGLRLDDVNIALQSLLRTGRLRMLTSVRWHRTEELQ